MAWEFKDISIGDIELKTRPKSVYKELYDKIFGLKVGQAFEVDAGTRKQASNIRNAVSTVLKKKGLSDRYIASNRLNKFYCGRIK